ncbi:bifunctional phosphopantothenoylcysteine decarboxylase/phosphopantothenate--cysteine ligase CoaBC [Tropheryma whipplei]|uniref:bifunctional phosphopantothenoylcysteine decarboxylase/phosphopantothenate--cysteine ligase CoaBC n=1 Tax=Tropheryma whipplei TaxID=2039 RepID=UPI0005A88889|nr:bifunctional phosphopantothenoylcysteine decarboxylase/phosphopantothenate--cysteine ligase CoaBC [Tropheryma whipplei]
MQNAIGRIFLGVCGSISAYKSVYLARLFVKEGYDVRVGFTNGASQFVAGEPFRVFTGHHVLNFPCDDQSHIDISQSHIDISRWADAIVVAPATANILAAARAGLASDIVTQTILSSRSPVLFVPSMHTAMWENPATRDNVNCLLERGYHVLGPVTGDLSSGDWGIGRMVDPCEIVQYVSRSLLNHQTGKLSGKKFLITAGGTRQPIDPVRYIGNRSSGKQAIAIAKEAQKRSAEVILIAANVEAVTLPTGMRVITVATAEEMRKALSDNIDTSDVVIMAAAVSDFQPREVASQKIKSNDGWTLQLISTDDLLRELASNKSRPRVLVGFSAETEESANCRIDIARQKLLSKGCDYMVVNQVGFDVGFDVSDTEVSLIDDKQVFFTARGSKDYIAKRILDFLSERVIVTYIDPLDRSL